MEGLACGTALQDWPALQAPPEPVAAAPHDGGRRQRRAGTSVATRALSALAVTHAAAMRLHQPDNPLPPGPRQYAAQA